MPKLLTSRGDYGLLLMVFLAKNSRGGPISLSEVAFSSRLPQPFLEQIALDLRRAQLLAAKRGKHGGYLLTRRPEFISIVEVLEALEGPLQTVPCQDNKCVAPLGCLTRDFWAVFQRHLHKTLQRITLADLVAENPRKLLPITDDRFDSAHGHPELVEG